VTGVIVGIAPDFTTESFSDVKIAASTAGSVIVNVDPEAEYEVDVTGTTLAAADVGLNINIAATAATTSGGLTRSNMVVDSATKATTATLQFRIVRLATSAAGVLGDRCVVRLNKSSANLGATGV
jgi:hypothetical protein